MSTINIFSSSSRYHSGTNSRKHTNMHHHHNLYRNKYQQTYFFVFKKYFRDEDKRIMCIALYFNQFILPKKSISFWQWITNTYINILVSCISLKKIIYSWIWNKKYHCYCWVQYDNKFLFSINYLYILLS